MEKESRSFPTPKRAAFSQLVIYGWKKVDGNQRSTSKEILGQPDFLAHAHWGVFLMPCRATNVVRLTWGYRIPRDGDGRSQRRLGATGTSAWHNGSNFSLLGMATLTNSIKDGASPTLTLNGPSSGNRFGRAGEFWGPNLFVGGCSNMVSSPTPGGKVGDLHKCLSQVQETRWRHLSHVLWLSSDSRKMVLGRGFHWRTALESLVRPNLFESIWVAVMKHLRCPAQLILLVEMMHAT